MEVEPGEPVLAFGMSWSSALNDHPQRDLALRLDVKGKSLFYSGDGRPTGETTSLAERSDLMIHEAFHIFSETFGHGTVAECLEMASACQVRRLALVHIQREVRRERFHEIKELARSVQDLEVLIPEPGDRVTI